METIGYSELRSAPSVFVRRRSDFGVIFLLVYVDDIIVIVTTKSGIDFVVSKFEELRTVCVKNEVDLFIGVELDWKKGGEKLVLLQQLYVLSILRRFGMEKENLVKTPMVESFRPLISTEEDNSECNKELYQGITGYLQNLGLRTRLDILPAVFILSRYQSTPTTDFHKSSKHIPRNLSGTVDHGIMYVAKDIPLSAFVDSDYADGRIDRKSISGYVVNVGGAPVYWRACKRPTVAL